MDITIDEMIAFLYEFCEPEQPILPDTELLESGLLDSMAFIELLDALADRGCELQPTRCPRSAFSTPESIVKLCRDHS